MNRIIKKWNKANTVKNVFLYGPLLSINSLMRSTSAKSMSTKSQQVMPIKEIETLVKSTELQNLVSNFNNLPVLAPAFSAKADDIEILNEPKQFYELLKNSIKNAKKHITLASLYFGSEEKELIECLTLALKNNPELKISILLDALRGTRKTKDGSSIEALLPLKKAFPDRVELCFYHTPDLNGWTKKLLPNRFNETIGLMHIKAYLFDEQVILSGANLSKDYFENRQDRYYLFKNNFALSNYFANLIDTISQISYNVDISDPSVPYLLKINQFPDPVYENEKYKYSAYLKLMDFINEQHTFSITHFEELNEGCDTIIVPTIQMAPLKIFQDQTVTLNILRQIDAVGRFQNKKYNVAITSGYFNFNQLYQQRILSTAALFRIITASPQANGFFNSKGVSKYIPDAYTLIEKDFLTKVQKGHRDNTIKVEEYSRLNWTYHAKGLWLYQPHDNTPFLTMIGSPNYGSRSLERDLEAQAIIITSNKHLRNSMQKELDHIEQYVKQVNIEDLEVQSRQPRPFAKLATPIIRSML